jgi:hypothetical protein
MSSLRQRRLKWAQKGGTQRRLLLLYIAHGPEMRLDIGCHVSHECRSGSQLVRGAAESLGPLQDGVAVGDVYAEDGGATGRGSTLTEASMLISHRFPFSRGRA